MPMANRPERTRVYQHLFFDSGRWADFVPRDGDVIVCTSYKAGTTWTQMICALLIHGRVDLPAPLAELSPWLDMRLADKDDVLARFAAQDFRRVIKTHTALDGLPYYDNVHYVYCGRDPRDVFMSLQNHLENADMERIGAALRERGIDFSPPPPLPDDLDSRFRLWLTRGAFEWEEDGLPFWSHFRHAETFWAHRDLPNMHLLHYTDLKADLDGQMRMLATKLGISPDAEIWPSLVKAATFEDMKANANRTAPDTDHRIWKSNAQFFNKGENGQWRGALSEESQRLYLDISRSRYDPVMIDWLECGSNRAGRSEVS